MTTVPGCSDDAVVTSSISMAWAAVPLASAAQAAVVVKRSPITLTSPPDWSTRTASRAATLDGSALPRTATPSRSSSSSRVRSCTGGGSASQRSAAQYSASCAAAVAGPVIGALHVSYTQCGL